MIKRYNDGLCLECGIAVKDNYIYCTKCSIINGNLSRIICNMQEITRLEEENINLDKEIKELRSKEEYKGK